MLRVHNNLMQKISLQSTAKSTFYKTLNQRVNQYFKNNKLRKTGNMVLFTKAILMFCILLIPYIVLLNYNLSVPLQLLICVVMGIGMAGIGMNVMHDSNHNSFSSKQWINELLGTSIYFLAGNVYNWKIQHNLLHHSYTNIETLDEDIDIQGTIRLSKHTPWKPFHLYQPIYAFVLYGLLTINWALVVDFKQMPRYLKQKLSVDGEINPFREWTLLILSKIMYFIFWLAIPISILSISFTEWFIGFFVMHFVAGLILSIIFQMAHVVQNINTKSIEEANQNPLDWATHHLSTTCNFATNNRLMTYLIGGLNFQIEHHIFPNISHIHYPAIAKIVKHTSTEFNIAYHEHSTFKKAFLSHIKQLKKLAKPPTKA